MSRKIVKFDHEVRENIRMGIDVLASAVKTTMGPRGKTVLIERPGQHPTVTKDGVTVAKAINLSDKFQNLGVQVVKEAASRSAEEAGDGTTTATVLTQSLFEHGLRMISSGQDSVILRKSMEKAVDEIVDNLVASAKPIENKQSLKQIAMISANGEEEIAELITEAINNVGEDGSVVVEEAKGYKSELTIVEGVQLNRGYLSPYFITDQDKMHCMFEKPYIFLSNKKLDNMKDILKPLEAVLETSRPILVVANEIDNEALQGLVVNRVKGNLKVCAIKSPGFGNSRYDMLQDLSCLTGAKVFDHSDDISDFKIEDLGTCKKIIVKRASTLIIANKNFKENVENRIKSIKQRLNSAELEENEYEILNYRIHQLKGGVAILRIGASTEAEMIERRDRVDDALNATRAAIQEGIVPGGGVALVRAAHNISSEDITDDAGYSIVKQACLSPIKQIVKNTGRSPDLVIEKISEANSDVYGYDARNEIFGDMFELGVIDPLKVVRCAIQNACSAATLLLTSECAMVEEQKDLEN
jgi:chaperonin GroEL